MQHALQQSARGENVSWMAACAAMTDAVERRLVKKGRSA
jgi:hypothetical protein